MKKTRNTTAPTNKVLAHRIDALVSGQRVSLPGLGVVKCTKAAKAAKNHKRRFSLTKSTVAQNRRGYTFSEVVEALGLR